MREVLRLPATRPDERSGPRASIACGRTRSSNGPIGRAGTSSTPGAQDIAFRIADPARARGGEAAITVCDINAEMVGEGVRRAQAKDGYHRITGDAERS